MRSLFWVRVRVRFAFCSFGVSFVEYIHAVRVSVRVEFSVKPAVGIGRRAVLLMAASVKGCQAPGGRVRCVFLCFFLTNSIRDQTRLTVFVTSSRYRRTNSAQALKEINRFMRLNADPCSYARVTRLDTDSDFGEVCFDRFLVRTPEFTSSLSRLSYQSTSHEFSLFQTRRSH